MSIIEFSCDFGFPVIRTINEEIEFVILTPTFLLTFGASLFSMLFKIHYTIYPGRPIVSAMYCDILASQMNNYITHRQILY